MNRLKLNTDGQQALQSFAQALVRTPSPSGGEGAVADLIAAEMRRLGFDEVLIDEDGNVLGRVGPATGQALMLNSHMDTVGITDRAAWTVDPYAGEIDNGRLYGLGACDMKGGLAATVYGAALLRQRAVQLRGPVWVTCVGLEEPSEGTCTRALMEAGRVAPQWVVIAEPSGLNVVRAQRGHVEMLVTVKGKSAHSSTPELGDNAVYAASRLIFGLEILAGQLVTDPFLGSGILAVTDIHSQAVSRNAVPHRCELLLDRRLTVGETETMALQQVQRVIAREGLDADVQVIDETIRTYTGKTFRARRVSPPWAFDERHPLVQAMLQAARSAGLHPDITRWNFATEGAYTAGCAGVPTVGLGPGDPKMAHTNNEYVRLEQVFAAAEVYAALGQALLG